MPAQHRRLEALSKPAVSTNNLALELFVAGVLCGKERDKLSAMVKKEGILQQELRAIENVMLHALNEGKFKPRPQVKEEIFAAIVVVKQRGVEAAAVEVNRVGPFAVNARAGDEIIVEVAQRCAARAADGRAP